MTKHLVRLQQIRGDRGQGALEYIGILAVVAVVIGLAAAGFTAASGTIDAGITTLLGQVFGTGG